jgi:glutamate---cysteine ligase / carboxylate-amine ligase
VDTAAQPAPQSPPGETWPPEWSDGGYLTIGIEEELMLLDSTGLSPANQVDEVLELLRGPPSVRTSKEIHESMLEFATGVHKDCAAAATEVVALRRGLARTLRELGLRAAGSGTHPFAWPGETEVASGRRQEFLHGFLRMLARRESTFAMHLHMGVPDADRAVELMDRMRVHAPLLLALSANSPFWQGEDTGLASARIPLFQSFPRVGMPRPLGDWDSYVGRIAPLVKSGALPDTSYLWWDIRLRHEKGTVEIRIMDSQSTADRTVAIAALAQALAKLELEENYSARAAIDCHEVIVENRYMAARDGTAALFVDAESGEQESLRHRLDRLLADCEGHAEDLGCRAEMDHCVELVTDPSAARQRRLAEGPGGLEGMLEKLSDEFVSPA